MGETAYMLARKASFKFGDSIVHATRPEWGPGVITRAENITWNGHPAQQLNVRFATVGLKTLNTAIVDLLPAQEKVTAVKQTQSNSGWIEALETKTDDELMTSLPEEAGDPFRSMWERLAFVLDLYRFTTDAGPLLNWAVAQSGLADPLSRFSRHELETFFARWARHRDTQLSALLLEASRADEPRVQQMIKQAAPESRHVVQRLYARR
jgi:hypothetical protein